MKQLSRENIKALPSNITLPKPQVLNAEIGIVHIGAGAFFRSHQAWYTEQAMKLQQGNWGISAVSLNSDTLGNALNTQDGLYTLVEMEQTNRYSVIAAIKEILCYRLHENSVITRLSHPETKIVTLTITEKGYCFDHQHHLNWQSDSISQDVKHPSSPTSVIGLLALVCNLRRSAGLKPLKIISCDNLTGNGKKLKAALVTYSEKVFPDLAEFLAQNLVCPCTMVDSITPATDEALKQHLTDTFHYRDNWPIKRERFTQWVIEDILDEDIPAWREAGVIFTDDVESFELVKLRILNATHSALAYLGCLANIESVFDAINQPDLQEFIRQMMEKELAASFTPPKGLDIRAYCEQILKRYQNPAIRHLLAQIAWDGSQKLPVRIFPVIENNLANDLPIDCCVAVVAAWIHFIQRKQQNKDDLIDPMREELTSLVANCTNAPDKTTQDLIQGFLDLPLFPNALTNQPEFHAKLLTSYQALEKSDNSLTFIKEILQ